MLFLPQDLCPFCSLCWHALPWLPSGLCLKTQSGRPSLTSPSKWLTLQLFSNTHFIDHTFHWVSLVFVFDTHRDYPRPCSGKCAASWGRDIAWLVRCCVSPLSGMWHVLGVYSLNEWIVEWINKLFVLHPYLSPGNLKQSILWGPTLLPWGKGTKHQLWGWTDCLPSFVTSSQLYNPPASFPHLPNEDIVTFLMCVKQNPQLLAYPTGSGHRVPCHSPHTLLAPRGTSRWTQNTRASQAAG